MRHCIALLSIVTFHNAVHYFSTISYSCQMIFNRYTHKKNSFPTHTFSLRQFTVYSWYQKQIILNIKKQFKDIRLCCSFEIHSILSYSLRITNSHQHTYVLCVIPVLGIETPLSVAFYCCLCVY